jgi:hypothetical protein
LKIPSSTQILESAFLQGTVFRAEEIEGAITIKAEIPVAVEKPIEASAPAATAVV